MKHKSINHITLYANFLKKFLNPQQKLTVIFDCSNGTAGLVIKKLTTNNQQLTTYIINARPDGNFPAHGPNPMKQYALRDLKLAVKKHKADLGVIFDSDGDRVLFIDNQARLVNPDIITRLLIWHLKPKKIVIDVRTGRLIKNHKSQITNHKPILIKSEAGTYFIKKHMHKTHADLGVERTGHYFFKKFFYADGGILAAIEAVNAVSKLPYSLANLVDLLPSFYRSPEINVRHQVSDIKYQALFKKIERKYKKQANKISRLDGLTMEFKDYWFNVRSSNTESSLLRLNIEAASKKLLIQKTHELKTLLQPVK